MVSIEQYESLLKKKLGLIQQVYDNTQRQAKVIESEQYEDLVPLLETREELMAQVDEVNTQLLQTYSTKSDTETSLTLNQAIHQRLVQIDGLNKQNIALAEPAKQEIEKAFKHIQLGKKAVVNGYLKTQQTQGHRMDKKQ